MSGRLAPPSGTPYLVAVVAGAMAFLAVLAFETVQGAGRLVGVWEQGLAGTATIRVPAEGNVEAAAAAARALPGIASARVIPAQEAADLLLPWLGDGFDARTVPLPGLVDLRFGDAPPDSAALASAVAAAAPGAVYDDHALWRAPLVRAARGFRRLGIGSMVLMGLALVAMVTVAARASLAGAAETVRTLRLLGAHDAMIASSFDRRIAVRAFAGALVGAPLAALAVRLLPFDGVGESLGLALTTAPLPWAAAALLPVVCGALAWGTARAAILLMLRDMP